MMSVTRNNRVFVRNLDTYTSDNDFVSYFQRKYPSSVTGGNIVRDLSGRSKGFGFLNLADSLSLSRVLSEKNHVINGRKVLCKIASPQRRNQNVPKNFQKRQPKHMRELYVGNLNVSTTNHQLEEYFQNFGSVLNAHIIFDANNRSKGYGFVEFQSSVSVEQIQENRPHKINNQEVQTVRTYPKNVPIHLKKPTTVLYVLNYEDVDEESIEEYFTTYGDITLVSRKVKRPEDIKFMELQFVDYDAVDNICLADKHTINGCNVKVSKYLDDNLDKSNSAQTGAQNVAGPATTTKLNNTKSIPQRNSTSKSFQGTQTRAQKVSGLAITAYPNTTRSVREMISTSQSFKPTAPSAPMQDYRPDPPYNPHFVHVQQQQPLYPPLPSVPRTNPQPGPRSLDSYTRRSSTREQKNNNGCIIS